MAKANLLEPTVASLSELWGSECHWWGWEGMVHVVKSCTFSIPLKRLRSRIRYTFLRFLVFFLGAQMKRVHCRKVKSAPNGHPERNSCVSRVTLCDSVLYFKVPRTLGNVSRLCRSGGFNVGG